MDSEFPWAALIGVVGTLSSGIVGVWLTQRFAGQQAEAERQYRDRTRFHNERLDAYSDFIASHNEFLANTVILGGEPDNEVETHLRVRYTDAKLTFTSAYVRAKLLSCKKTREGLIDLFRKTNKLDQEGLGEDDANYNAVLVACVELEKIIGKELGILDADT